METTATARANEAADEMRESELDAINDYVICGLCHGIYREPYITILCRHTFCKSCFMIDLFNTQDTRDRKTCPAVRNVCLFNLHRRNARPQGRDAGSSSRRRPAGHNADADGGARTPCI
jgi:hypothetical protein